MTTGVVQKFSDLPASPSVGDIYQVTGSEETNFTSYYVEFGGANTWNETVAPDLENVIDATTMPHALIRQADGTFLFTPFTWDNRKVGDDSTNPKPGFIGRKINGVFFYQNRLAFLYDENVIASCSGDFGNFWRNTVLDYIDSDVVDFAASSTKVSILKDAVPFNDGVVLFADQTQFSMTNGEAGVTPASVAIKAVTNYEIEPGASPVALNTEVYFASGRSQHSRVYEYSRQSDNDALEAADVTAHVPRYIPSGIRRIIPAQDQNAVFVLTTGATNSVFVYQFYWLTSDTKAQSAWHRWDFPADVEVMSGTYVDGHLYLVLRRSDGMYLESIDLRPDAIPIGSPRQVYLDNRFLVLGTYDAGTGMTTFSLPYPVEDHDAFVLLRTEGWVSLALTEFPPDDLNWIDDATIKVFGNHSSAFMFGGYRYSLRFRPSRPFLRRGDGTAVTTGRLQLRTFTISFRNTGGFNWTIWPYGEAAGEIVEGTLGNPVGSLVLNDVAYSEGRFPIQVYSNAETAVLEIASDNVFGCAFQSAEWEAFFYNRSRG
jgi:hypothetical protein